MPFDTRAWKGSALVGAFAALAWAPGCEMSRPGGAYDGGVPWLAQMRTTAEIAPEELVGGEDPFSNPGEGLVPTDEAGVPIVDVDGGGNVGEVTNPLAVHTGDYIFKIVTVSRSDGGSNLGTVTTTSTSYGQMRVVLTPDGTLLGEEKLCYMDTDQVSSAGASVNTTIASGVAQNFLPITRRFTVEGNSWRTDVVRRRQGWRSDLSPDVMPTNPNDTSKFTDPDGDDVVGYRTTVEGSATVGGIISGGRTCTFDVVSYSDTAYVQGTFDTGGTGFSSAQIDAEDSDLYALYAQRTGGTGTCSTSDINSAAKSTIDSDRIALRRVPTLSDHRACQAKSAYISAL